MSQDSNNRSKDILGTGRLTVDAIIGITDIVESLHQTIVSMGGILGESDNNRTSGITGLVYKSIRGVTELAGKGLDMQLNRLNSMLGDDDSSPNREAVLAALNGVLGDHLASRNNPLAITMQFRCEGKALNEEELSEMIRQSKGKLAIMIHGLCMNDLQWNKEGHDHGQTLARDLELTPLYVHYNTGLHISENGKIFSDLLETILAQTSEPLELVIVAHSMGGLVSRSAYHYEEASSHQWINHLKKMVFIATPHHGTLLEKGGNWVDILLEISPYSAPFSRLGKIRSSGVTDLRYGNVVDEDWKDSNRFEMSGDPRIPVPLPENVESYAIAATIGKASNKLADDVIGDGLVSVNSALGHHKNPELTLSFPEDHQWIGRNMNHLDVLNRQEVYETLKNWLSPLCELSY